MPVQPDTNFLQPKPLERALNRVFGALVAVGIGLPHNYLLQVRGRKSGRIYSTPVNLLEINQRLFLVCPRGRAQWVINAEANGWVMLKKRRIRRFGIKTVTDNDKPPILKEYLARFGTTVRRYFPIDPGSPLSAFVPYAARYPVFELIATDEPP